MNKRCIYCLREEPEAAFTSEEHVISQFLGTYVPRLVFAQNLVCDQCNNNNLSAVENRFAEDSKEGLELAMLDVSGKKTVRFRGELTKMKLSSNGDLGMFANALPSILPGKQQVTLRASFVVRDAEGAIKVLWIDAFARLKKGSYKYRKIQEWLLGLNKKEMYIFADKDYTVDAIIALLQDMGITYNEKHREEFLTIERGDEIRVEFSGTMNDDILRFPAKVAFNYFSYCCLQGGYSERLYDKSFDRIRNYILNGKRDGDRPVRPDGEPTLYNEIGSRMRVIGHQVSFVYVDGRIQAKVTLLGGFNYTVDIAPYCFRVEPRTFGCGHAFNPFDQSIVQLQSSPVPIFGPLKFDPFTR